MFFSVLLTFQSIATGAEGGRVRRWHFNDTDMSTVSGGHSSVTGHALAIYNWSVTRKMTLSLGRGHALVAGPFTPAATCHKWEGPDWLLIVLIVQ